MWIIIFGSFIIFLRIKTPNFSRTIHNAQYIFLIYIIIILKLENCVHYGLSFEFPFSTMDGLCYPRRKTFTLAYELWRMTRWPQHLGYSAKLHCDNNNFGLPFKASLQSGKHGAEKSPACFMASTKSDQRPEPLYWRRPPRGGHIGGSRSIMWPITAPQACQLLTEWQVFKHLRRDDIL